MKSQEERITELEQRVAQLENVIKSSENEKTKTVKSIIEKTKLVRNEAISKRPVELTLNRQEEEEQTGSKGNGRKDKEALVGKYIVGALAAVLIFVSAISFISLVWNRMTPEIKLSIILLAGIILSALGFWLIRTKKNSITSVILGTGAGLLFIAILSANLVFHMIGNNMSIFLAGIWAVFFIISSRYTNLFFTTVISYIGSYIALVLGLALMQGDMELLVLILFASSISAVMIYITLKSSKAKLITSVVLSIFSYATILIFCYLDGFLFSKQLLSSYAAQTAVIIFIYLLMNMFYKIVNNTDAIPVYLGVSIFTTIMTMVYIGHLSGNYLKLNAISRHELFFTANLLQFLLNTVFYKRIEKWLTRYYAVLLVVVFSLINIEFYEVPTGIIMIGLLLVVSGKVFKRETQSLLIGLIILLDSLFLICNASDNLICSFYGLLQLGLMVYVLWESNNLKKYAKINILKTIGIVVIIINSFGIPSNIINYMSIPYIDIPYISKYADNAVGYFIAVIIVIILIKTGYFKNWKSEQFKFFGRNDALENDKGMQILLYLSSTVLYFYGLRGIASADKVLLQLIFTLAAIAIALIQSRIILSGNGRNKTLTGIWIVIKYLMLTWTILWSFLDLDIVSVAYSIAGLIVAIVSISVGFKLRNRSIRLYGLVLTIIMVAKFIFVDLSQENSITRVLALVAGGGLCFLISYIYNKLSENYS